MKISFYSHANPISFSYEKISTRTRFEKEAKGNSEMAYYEWFNFTCYHPPGNPRDKSNRSGLGVGNCLKLFSPGVCGKSKLSSRRRSHCPCFVVVVVVVLKSSFFLSKKCG